MRSSQTARDLINAQRDGQLFALGHLLGRMTREFATSPKSIDRFTKFLEELESLEVDIAPDGVEPTVQAARTAMQEGSKLFIDRFRCGFLKYD